MKNKIEILKMKNNGNDSTIIIAEKDGFLQCFMPNGDPIPFNLKLNISDNIDEPLTCTATFICRLGKVIGYEG